MDFEQLSVIIESFYDAAMNPSGWQNVATSLACAFDAPSCAIQIQDNRATQSTILGFTDNYDAKSLAEYEAHYCQYDPYVIGAKASAIGPAFVGQALIGDRELLASEFYNDWSRRVGVFHLVGSLLPLGPQAVGAIGIHRSYDMSAFTETDRSKLGLLLPHLTKALRIQSRLQHLEDQQKIGLDAMDALAVGIIVVSARGYVLFANKSAETILQTGRGLSVWKGCLHVPLSAKNQALQQAINDASVMSRDEPFAADNVLALPRSGGEAPLSLVVCPARCEAFGIKPIQPIAMIFVNDPDSQTTPSQAKLAALYQLTPAEAKLTTALLNGEHLQDYSARVGIGIQTAKSHLKQVFAKTGKGRQTDLIREILSNPVLRINGG